MVYYQHNNKKAPDLKAAWFSITIVCLTLSIVFLAEFSRYADGCEGNLTKFNLPSPKQFHLASYVCNANYVIKIQPGKRKKNNAPNW